MSKNRLVSSNNAITIQQNGENIALTPKVNFEGNVVSVVENTNGSATIKLDLPDKEVSEGSLDDNLGLKVNNYNPICINNGSIDENGEANLLVKNATEFETIWPQPVLDSDGIIGESSFALYSETEDPNNPLWQIFDNNNSTEGCFQSDSNITNSSMTMYFENPLKITKLSLAFKDNNNYISSFKLQASLDNVTYIDLGTYNNLQFNATNICNVTNIRYFRFYRIVGLSAIGSYSISEMKISGTYLRSIADAGFIENFINIGGIAISSQGIASGFSNSKYLVLPEPFNVGQNTWEINFHFTTANDVTSTQAVFGTPDLSSQGYDPITLAIYNQHFSMEIYPNIGTNIGTQGTYTVQPNTEYWVKVKFTGTAYTLEYSLDGSQFITDITVESTQTIYTLKLAIGIQALGSSSSYYLGSPFLGSINLKDCYINIANQRWWDCTSTYTLVQFNDNFNRTNTFGTKSSIQSDGNGWEAYTLGAQGQVGISNNQLQIQASNTTSASMYRRSLEDYSQFKKLKIETLFTLVSDRVSANQQLSFGIGIDNYLVTAYSGTNNCVLGRGLELVLCPGSQNLYIYQDGTQLISQTFTFEKSVKYQVKMEVELNKISIKIWNSNLEEPAEATLTYTGKYTLIGKYLVIAANNSAETTFITTLDDIKISLDKLINSTAIEPWNQPILTSDLDVGLVSASSYQEGYEPYKALDGLKTEVGFRFNNETTGYWRWDLPYIINIKKINFYNIFSDTEGERVIEGQFFADGAMTTPIGNSFTTNDISGELTTINNIPTEGVSTHTIYFNKTGGNANSGIGELEITAEISPQSTVFFNTNKELTLTDSLNNTVKLDFIEPLPVHQHTYIPIIPSMTGYTTPSGTVTGVGGEYANSNYWKAFMGNSPLGVVGVTWYTTSAAEGGPIYTPVQPIGVGTYRFKFQTDPYDTSNFDTVKSLTVIGIRDDDSQVELWTINNIQQNIGRGVIFISPDIEIFEEYKSIYFRCNASWTSILELCNCQVYKMDPTGTIAFDNDKLINIAIDTQTSKSIALDQVHIQKTQPDLNVDKENFYNNEATITNRVLYTAATTRQCIMADQVFNPGDQPWEIDIHFITGGDLSSNLSLTGNSSNLDFKVPVIYINSSNFKISISSNGTSWDIANGVVGTYTVQPNTEYWVKVKFTGTAYTLEYSLDGSQFITDITVESTTPIYVDNYNTIAIGNNLSNSSAKVPFIGPIFLDDLTFKVNDEVVWTPYTQETLPDNQYWIDNSVYPYRVYLSTGNQFNEAPNLVWVGNVTMTNGKITNLFTNPYNYNGIGRIMNEAWQRETSGFRTFWEFDQHEKRIREWCEQWGLVLKNIQTVYFLKSYIDTNYLVLVAWDAPISGYNAVSTTNYTVNSFDSYNALNRHWKTEGYLN